jgi:hypothetical protein
MTLNLPAEIHDYRNQRNAVRGRVPSDILESWEEHIIQSRLCTRGEQGAYDYLRRRRFNEDNLVHLAIHAEEEGYPDVAVGFWKRAYKAHLAGSSKKEAPQPIKVFLCHSSDDKAKVRQLYHRLRNDGFDAWLDEEKLLPGQEWAQEIPKAVRQSDVVLVCLSQASISKIGYVQKEIRFALDVAEEQPEGFIFIIPVKLEECSIPERLRKWHWVELFNENGYRRLILSLQLRGNSKGV